MPRIPGDPTGRLDLTIQAANMRPRNAARGILAIAAEHDGMTERVAPHIAELLAEVDHWKDSWAHAHNDVDRTRREESAKALDCGHHGKIIAGLEADVHRLDDERERVEKARLTLVAFMHGIDQFIAAYDAKVAGGESLPDVGALIEALRTYTKRGHAAHLRAFAPSKRSARS